MLVGGYFVGNESEETHKLANQFTIESLPEYDAPEQCDISDGDKGPINTRVVVSDHSRQDNGYVGTIVGRGTSNITGLLRKSDTVLKNIPDWDGALPTPQQLITMAGGTIGGKPAIDELTYPELKSFGVSQS